MRIIGHGLAERAGTGGVAADILASPEERYLKYEIAFEV